MHARDERKKPGIKRSFLPLPSSIDGEQCFCITIPDGLDNKKALIDLLTVATYWFNWDRSTGDYAAQVAHRWRDLLNLPEGIEMSCCCGSSGGNPTRFTSDGTLEISTDGGTTWNTFPNGDPRLNSALAQPLSGADGDNKKCRAAQSATEFISSQLVDQINDGMTFAQIMQLILAVVALVLSGGSASVVLVPIILTIVGGVLNVGATAIQGAFDATQIGILQCIMYCNMQPDGSFTEAGWQQVKLDIIDQMDVLCAEFIRDNVNVLGVVGLTNAARAGLTTGILDCGGCGCAEPCSFPQFHFLYGDVTSVVDNGDGTLTLAVSSTAAPDLTQAIRWGDYPTAPSTTCCNVLEFTILDPAGGSTPGWYTRDCSGTEFNPSGFDPGCFQSVQYIQNFALTVPFHATLKFGSACP